MTEKERLEVRIASLTAARDSLKPRLADAKTAVDAVIEAYGELSGKMDALDGTIDGLQKELDALEQQTEPPEAA